MDDFAALREQLLALLDGGHAHMPFEKAIEGFPPEAYNTPMPNLTYTPWHLLEHLRIAQWDILEFVRDPDHVSPPWPEGYWPAPEARVDQEGWEATIAGFQADLEAMKALVRDPSSDLLGDLPHAPGYSLLREALLVADHNAYHIGEFAALRAVMGTWPK